jgi:hypothetical protein
MSTRTSWEVNMQIPISSELEDLAKQYPLSYREVYALSIGVEKEKLETTIRQITGFGMSVEGYLIKMCYFSPVRVRELLYSPCSYVRLSDVNKLKEQKVNGSHNKYV